VGEDFVYRHYLEFGGIKLGRVWRFPPDALEKYLACREKETLQRNPLPLPKIGERGAHSKPLRVPHKHGRGNGRSGSRTAIHDNRQDPFDLLRYARTNLNHP